MKDIKDYVEKHFIGIKEVNIILSEDGIIKCDDIPRYTDLYTDGSCYYLTSESVFRNFNIIVFINREDNVINSITIFVKSKDNVIKTKTKNKVLEFISYAEYII